MDEKLRGSILNGPKEEPREEQPLQPHSNLTVSIEGPYWHSSPYHLTYKNLILVAGGIGISSFLAILCDILHRIKDNKPCMPRNILIVWAMKKSDKLPLLYSLDMESICPFFPDILNLEIQTYVTRESEPQLEDGQVSKSVNFFGYPIRNKCGISVLVGTGNIIWFGVYVMVSTIGLVLSVGLLQIFYINPFDITYWWYKGLLFVICMVASPIVFGGVVIGLWHLWERKTLAREAHDEDDGPKIDTLEGNEARAHKESSQNYVASSNFIQYGCKPNFKGISSKYFGRILDKWKKEKIIANQWSASGYENSHFYAIFTCTGKTIVLATSVVVPGGTVAYLRSRYCGKRPNRFGHYNGVSDNKEQLEKVVGNENIVKKSRQKKKGGLKSLQVLASILLSHMG